MASVTQDPLVGQTVDGRYQVTERVASGGMATVYRARDTRLNRELALKVMHPHLAEGDQAADFVARFRREARAGAGVSHPGVVAMYDQGHDGDLSYLTMEYVPGTNLRQLLREGALTVRRTFALLDQVLSALSAAHDHGVVHRDIKPENVLLNTNGRKAKVADFGLARAVTEMTQTSTGTVFGTVAYMAPEVISTGKCDVRADVYAVGIMAFEMLTGKQPFSGDTPIQVAYAHVNRDIPTPSTVVEGLGDAVEHLVRTLAARDPADRPADGRAALQLLRAVWKALPAEVLDATPQDLGTPETPPPAPTSPVGHAGTPGPRTDISPSLLPPLGPRTANGPQHAAAVPITRPRRRGRIGALITIAILLALLLIGLAWADGDGRFDWVRPGPGTSPAAGAAPAAVEEPLPEPPSAVRS
ncbi:protein kinase domain-containing protein [Myceligenerans indicum]|uniref:Serine/threonine protein kinase n=1 Tax=Myceligenerans indicum TaxID=2593663 RepID=A0ABS1LKD5_9MICO|nr:protein kinase [Myceligenerans indicum]MBL0886573.1 serine/threonine protein kinase [Myceligenerans indicum]